MRDIKRKDIGYDVRLKIAIRNRALKDICSKIKCESSAEAFNQLDLRREPDTIGITLYYPDKQRPTHIKTEFFPNSIDDVALEKQIQRMEKDLYKKVPALRDK